jgi:hypothetical protein
MVLRFGELSDFGGGACNCRAEELLVLGKEVWSYLPVPGTTSIFLQSRIPKGILPATVAPQNVDKNLLTREYQHPRNRVALDERERWGCC